MDIYTPDPAAPGWLRLFTPRHHETGVRVKIVLPNDAPDPLAGVGWQEWAQWTAPDGTLLEIRRAPCGLDCYCDAEYRRVDTDHRASRA